jgi:hypothetical protein
MSIGGNTGLLALTGTVQQKSALAAYNKLASRPEPSQQAEATGTSRLGSTEKQGQDTAILSRAGITALENTQTIGDETVIRGDDSAAEALDISRRQILEYTDDALRAQANQTAEQLLALYGS